MPLHTTKEVIIHEQRNHSTYSHKKSTAIVTVVCDFMYLHSCRRHCLSCFCVVESPPQIDVILYKEFIIKKSGTKQQWNENRRNHQSLLKQIEANNG